MPGILENESKTIDILKLLLAFMVVGIHCFSLFKYDGFDGTFYYNSSFYDFVRIFLVQCVFRLAVPIFFIISGFLYFINLKKWDSKKYKSKIKNRFNSLLVPYVFWNLISLISIISIEYIAVNGFIIDFNELAIFTTRILKEHGFFRIFWDNNCVDLIGIENILGYKTYSGGPINMPLWFMRDLIFLSILAPFILFLVNKFGKYYLYLLSILYIFNIWMPFTCLTDTGLLFYSLGAYLAIKKNKLIMYSNKLNKCLFFINLILMIIVVMTYNYYPLLYGISLHIFTIIGSLTGINLVYHIVLRCRINSRSCYSSFSFFVFVTHYNIFLPISYLIIKRIIPYNGDMFCILKFFSTICLIIVLSYFTWNILCRTKDKYILSLIGNRR